MTRRPWLAPLLVLLLVAVPLLEIYVLVQVGQTIGAGWTILLLVLASVVGVAMVRREGRRAWQALTEALQTGRMPHRELADGALVLAGGLLMVVPGFVTDALGVLLILPLTRPVARTVLAGVVARRIGVSASGRVHDDPARDVRRPGPSGSGPVVRGEVVEDE